MEAHSSERQMKPPVQVERRWIPVYRNGKWTEELQKFVQYRSGPEHSLVECGHT